MEIFMFG